MACYHPACFSWLAGVQGQHSCGTLRLCLLDRWLGHRSPYCRRCSSMSGAPVAPGWRVCRTGRCQRLLRTSARWPARRVHARLAGELRGHWCSSRLSSWPAERATRPLSPPAATVPSAAAHVLMCTAVRKHVLALLSSVVRLHHIRNDLLQESGLLTTRSVVIMQLSCAVRTAPEQKVDLKGVLRQAQRWPRKPPCRQPRWASALW